MINKEITTQQLAELQIFRGMEHETLQKVIEKGELVKLQKEDYILKRQQHNHAVFVLLEGVLDVFMDFQADPVSRMFAGQIFGEISMLDKKPVSAEVKAYQDCLVLKMGEELVWSLISLSHPFSQNIMFILASRLRTFSDQLSNAKNNQRNLLADNLDSATGLYNRNWFDTYFPQELAQAKTLQTSLVLMMLQIKTGNHQADQALHNLSSTLQLHFRGFQHFSRFDHDKLVAIISRCEINEVKKLCQNYADAHESEHFQLLFSFSQQTPVDSPESLIDKTINLLKKADKHSQQNQVLDWSAFA